MVILIFCRFLFFVFVRSCRVFDGFYCGTSIATIAMCLYGSDVDVGKSRSTRPVNLRFLEGWTPYLNPIKTPQKIKHIPLKPILVRIISKQNHPNKQHYVALIRN